MRRIVIIVIGSSLCVGMLGLFVFSAWWTPVLCAGPGGPSAWVAGGGILVASHELRGGWSVWAPITGDFTETQNRTLGLTRPSRRPVLNGWNTWKMGSYVYTPKPGEWIHYPDGSVTPPKSRQPSFRRYFVRFPLYLPFLLVAVPTFLVWWKRPRRRRGHCPQCNYDLTGNVSGTCPECGAAI
jgi:hypothetical protein